MTHSVPAESISTSLLTYEQERGGHHGFIVNTGRDAVWLNDEHAASVAGYILAKVGAREEAARKAEQEAEEVALEEAVEEAVEEIVEELGE